MLGELADAGEVSLLGAGEHREQSQVAWLPAGRSAKRIRLA